MAKRLSDKNSTFATDADSEAQFAFFVVNTYILRQAGIPPWKTTIYHKYERSALHGGRYALLSRLKTRIMLLARVL